MNHVLTLVVCCLMISCATSKQQAGLFVYDKKIYTRDDLPIDAQQRIYVLEAEYFNKLQQLLAPEVLEIYYGELSKERKKSVAELKKELFPKVTLSDTEKKKYYEDHKADIPYPYEMIHGELDSYVNETKREEIEHKMLLEIVQKKGARYLFSAPAAVKTKIATSNYPTKGDAGAKVEIVEFGDFTCPNCKATVAPLANLLEKYKGRVKLTFKFFLLHAEGASERLARGGYCAMQQGKFWQFHDFIFEKQLEYMWRSPSAVAKEIGLDQTTFDACYSTEDAKQYVAKSHQEGLTLGITKTPTFFINGKMFPPGGGIEALEKRIQDEL